MSKVTLCLVLVCLPMWGQARPRQLQVSTRRVGAAVDTVPTEAGAALQAILAQAAVVFAGRVEKVDRADAAGYVDVTFRVLEPVRGCSRLGRYVLREWAGLWIGPDRYQVGERLLMLLVGRGPSGMSAPVGGSDGRIPLLATLVAPIADARGVTTADDGTDGNDVTAMAVDLRWLQATAVVRGVGAGGVRSQVSLPVLGDPDPVTGGGEPWAGPVAALPVVDTQNPATGQPTVAAVLALLRSGKAGGTGAY